MKPPFQYLRRAEADNFRTKVKLVRSAFRSPRSIAVSSHQPRRGPALLVNGLSSAATAHSDSGVSEVPNHKQCHNPKPGFLRRLCGWGSRCASASKAPQRRTSLSDSFFVQIALTAHQRFPGMNAFVPDDNPLRWTDRLRPRRSVQASWPARSRASTAGSPYLNDFVLDIVGMPSHKPCDLPDWDLAEEQIT
jgi:hypothetical protein